MSGITLDKLWELGGVHVTYENSRFGLTYSEKNMENDVPNEALRINPKIIGKVRNLVIHNSGNGWHAISLDVQIKEEGRNDHVSD